MSRGDVAVFEESWAIALRVADSMTRNRGQISADDYAVLERHWNSGQIIEILSVIGLFNYFNRFAISLDIPPTK